MINVIFGLLLMQQIADPIRTAEQAQLLVQARARAISDANQRQAKLQLRSFEDRFNALIKAADAFARKYNENGGEVWPQREAAALDKALADLRRAPELNTNKERTQRR